MTRSDAAPQPIAALTLAALGIVYGDIGTSPLYAAKEVFNPTHGIEFTAANVIGGVSTILWALMFVVTLKYVLLIMRADNKGEGGIMALLALAATSVRERTGWVILEISGTQDAVSDAREWLEDTGVRVDDLEPYLL